jgi:hypothetical protein
MKRSERDASRLLDLIRQAGAPIPGDARFQATHAPASSRVEGGAVWVLVRADGRPTEPLVCSQWPRAYLLRSGVTAAPDRFGEWIVYPAKFLG